MTVLQDDLKVILETNTSIPLQGNLKVNLKTDTGISLQENIPDSNKESSKDPHQVDLRNP